MKLARYPTYLLFTIIGALSGQASAAVIDFNSLAVETSNPFVTVAQPYIEDGFSLYTRGGVSFNYSGGTINATTDKNTHWTGTPGVYSDYVYQYGSAFVLERVGGGAFDLVSMDAASFYTGGPGNDFVVYGYPALGGYVTKSFTLDSTTKTLETLTFNDSFKGLNKIIFSSVYAQVDNINLSVAAAVPEPETYAMFLAGLGLMGAVTRRRNQK